MYLYVYICIRTYIYLCTYVSIYVYMYMYLYAHATFDRSLENEAHARIDLLRGNEKDVETVTS